MKNLDDKTRTPIVKYFTNKVMYNMVKSRILRGFYVIKKTELKVYTKIFDKLELKILDIRN